MISDTIKHYIKNFSWMMMENFIKVIIGLSVTIYVIRYLGPSDFGLLSYALSIVGILYPIATLGLDAILLRNIIKYKENEQTFIKTGYITRLIAGTSLFILTSLIVYFYSDNKVFVWIMFILSFGMIIDSFSIYKEYFTAHVQNKYIAISGILSNIFAGILKLYFIFAKFSVIWFSSAFVIQKLVNVLSLKYFYNKNINNNKKSVYDRKLATQMLKDSWPLMFASFSSFLYLYTDQILIEYYLGFEEVGLYATGTMLILFLYIIPSIISNIIYPKIIEIHKRLNKNEFILKLEKIYFLNFLLALLVFVFFIIFGDILITNLFGKAFQDSVDVLMIYAFGLILVFFKANNNKLLMINNLQKLMLSRNILGLGINFILNIFLIPKYGIIGAAFSTVLTEIFIMLSYGLNIKTRYIMYLQLKAFIYPIFLLRSK